MPKVVNLIGQRYGRLTVVSLNGSRKNTSGKSYNYWECKCDCGNTVFHTTGNLTSGKIKSCGCYRKEILRHPTHGETGTYLYWEFIHMRQRCSDKNKDKKFYKHYAGRGIRVCKEWDSPNAYPIFRDWALSNGYKEGLSIERIDVNGDYCPENCTWIDMKEQQYNKTCTVLVNGKSLAKMAREYGIEPRLALGRYKAGWDLRDILHTKPGEKRKYGKRTEVNTV